jgi:3-phenylpropionate/trans-cinnamate dioxygenase ferredoxin subunit
MDEGFIKVCRVSELRENQGKRFLINDVDIAVFKVNGEVFVLNNTCPHQHATIIYDGFVEEGCVVCPAHGWMFNLKTGNQPTGARGLDVYPVKVVKDEVFALVKPKELKW